MVFGAGRGLLCLVFHGILVYVAHANQTKGLGVQTPYYLIDKSCLLRYLEKISWLRDASGVKCLLALKCFATWSVFDFMAEHMDGSTSSSLYEVRLGREKFPGETHAYSVAYADHEIAQVLAYSDKIIFNSIGQLAKFNDASQGHVCAACGSILGCRRPNSIWPILPARLAGWANMTLRKSLRSPIRSAG